MKKMIFTILSLFLCFGCVNQTAENQQLNDYTVLKQQLLSQQDFDDHFPFSVSLVFNQLENQYRYDIIINDPQETMYNVFAIAYGGESNEEICPTIGVFDEIEYNLKPNFVDKVKGFYKGVQLSGTCLEKKSIKLYVAYYRDQQKTERVEKYIEVNEE